MSIATYEQPVASAATEVDTASEKRHCIVTFMDNHPEVFAAPEAAATWTEFLEQSCTPIGRDSLVLDQAVGRLMQVLRSAQENIPQELDLADMLRQAKDQGMGDIAPDPSVRALATEESSPEDIETMARAMTLYKECMNSGVATGSEIYDAIHAGFEHLPADTPFMRDLIDTAKRITLIDLNLALGNG
ncbi:hypothetical protein [Roseateles amylovorans]|uniref:Uncharacterized protein n=1 Tax=Roseateles amylovorans TaxID=2978473 RepID=A0ABY6B3M7_9BURK|nr:hypothetical protein [Roseateles amylovorans]UXH79534.1 hypothetical protein N4261_06315 [Roseateles amylovorans]